MSMQERPASLRRRPRPAADETVDPVDTPPATATATDALLASTTNPPRARRRREITVPFSTRLAPDVVDLIDRATTEHDLTIRAVVETAIRRQFGG